MYLLMQWLRNYPVEHRVRFCAVSTYVMGTCWCCWPRERADVLPSCGHHASRASGIQQTDWINGSLQSGIPAARFCHASFWEPHTHGSFPKVCQALEKAPETEWLFPSSLSGRYLLLPPHCWWRGGQTLGGGHRLTTRHHLSPPT